MVLGGLQMRKILLFFMVFMLIFSKLVMSGDLKLEPPRNAIHCAVIPSINSTGDPSLDWISIGLHDAMTVDLMYLKDFETMTLPNFPYDLEKNIYNPNLEELIKYAKIGYLQHIWIGEYKGDAKNIVVEFSVVDVQSSKLLTKKKLTAPLNELLKEVSNIVLEVAMEVGIEVDEDEKKRVLSPKTSSVDAWKLNAEGYNYQKTYSDLSIKTWSKENAEKM